jgi:hypothetical protein
MEVSYNTYTKPTSPSYKGWRTAPKGHHTHFGEEEEEHLKFY